MAERQSLDSNNDLPNLSTVSADYQPASQWGVESVETPLAPLIRNADATLVELQCGGTVVPMIIPDRNPQSEPRERCSVTCMESAAIGYVMDEWRNLHHPTRLQLTVAKILGAFSSCGPWRRAVQVGSLPFTTTLRTPEAEDALWRILPDLREGMPERPFMVRNILDGRLPKILPKDGVILPTWVNYCWDFSQGASPTKKNFRVDRNHFLKSGLGFIEDEDFDDSRVEEALKLYDSIYRQRHSLRNPAYTPEFIALSRARGWLRLRGLVDPDSGKMVAFADLSSVGSTMAPALMGYDLTVDRGTGLYRQIVAMMAVVALERRMKLNLASGAGAFKRHRGYLPSLEQFIVFPALKGPRRWSDRAVIAMSSRLTHGMTMETMMAAGG